MYSYSLQIPFQPPVTVYSRQQVREKKQIWVKSCAGCPPEPVEEKVVPAPVKKKEKIFDSQSKAARKMRLLRADPDRIRLKICRSAYKRLIKVVDEYEHEKLTRPNVLEVQQVRTARFVCKNLAEEILQLTARLKAATYAKREANKVLSGISD